MKFLIPAPAILQTANEPLLTTESGKKKRGGLPKEAAPFSFEKKLRKLRAYLPLRM